MVVINRCIDFCKKSCMYHMCKFYKINLYKLILILLSYDVIYKQKLINLICEIIYSATILIFT